MKKLTLKQLEKIMIKLVKDNQEHAENIKVKKLTIKDFMYFVIFDTRIILQKKIIKNGLMMNITLVGSNGKKGTT